MLKKVLLFTFLVVTTLASAQGHDVNVVDTDAMKQKAQERAELVDETVDLTKDQLALVYEAYMWVERQDEAMKQRYKDAPADYQADVKHMWKKWDDHVNTDLQGILNTDQMRLWVESLE